MSFAYAASALRACAEGEREGTEKGTDNRQIFKKNSYTEINIHSREREQAADAEILSGS